jgi:carboxymethylenebutenolidase
MEKVSFGTAAAGIPGYECGDKTLPGIIVLQEWWGVTENIKKQALFLSSKVTTSLPAPHAYTATTL